MARRGARRIEDFTSFRTALSSLETQALSAALHSCAPQVESSCHQLECQAVSSVLQSILTQVQSAELALHLSPQTKLDLERDSAGEDRGEDMGSFGALRERLEKCKSQVESTGKRADSVKSRLKSSISAYEAETFARSERKSQRKRALNDKKECIERVSEAAVSYQDKMAEIELWRRNKADLDEVLAAKVREYEDLQAILANLGDVSELNAAQSHLETAKMALEELFAKQILFQDQISHTNAQISVLQQTKNAQNSDFLSQTALQARLKHEISSSNSKLEQLTSKLHLAKADSQSKRRITANRWRDFERICMEKADDLSNIATKRLQWTRTKADLERDYEGFVAKAARLNAEIVQGNAKARQHEKREDRDWVEAQCRLLEEEYQGRKSTVAREAQSAYSLKTEN